MASPRRVKARCHNHHFRMAGSASNTNTVPHDWAASNVRLIDTDILSVSSERKVVMEYLIAQLLTLKALFAIVLIRRRSKRGYKFYMLSLNRFI